MSERDGWWYVLEHQILDAQGRVALDFGRSYCSDWSRSGELLFAREGYLFRIVVDGKSELGAPEELIDLRDLKFEASVAPPQATVWKGRSPRARLFPLSRRRLRKRRSRASSCAAAFYDMTIRWSRQSVPRSGRRNHPFDIREKGPTAIQEVLPPGAQVDEVFEFLK
jgi:hypothetical protein